MPLPRLSIASAIALAALIACSIQSSDDSSSGDAGDDDSSVTADSETPDSGSTGDDAGDVTSDAQADAGNAITDSGVPVYVDDAGLPYYLSEYGIAVQIDGTSRWFPYVPYFGGVIGKDGNDTFSIDRICPEGACNLRYEYSKNGVVYYGAAPSPSYAQVRETETATGYRFRSNQVTSVTASTEAGLVTLQLGWLESLRPFSQ